jgi:hypothetical protein
LRGGLGRIEFYPGDRLSTSPLLAFYDQIGSDGAGQTGQLRRGQAQNVAGRPRFEPKGGLRQGGLFQEHTRAREGKVGTTSGHELRATGGAGELPPVEPAAGGNERDDEALLTFECRRGEPEPGRSMRAGEELFELSVLSRSPEEDRNTLHGFRPHEKSRYAQPIDVVLRR